MAEENKKLRALLAQHGVRDESIEVYLQTSSTADKVTGGQYGSQSEAVQVLEQLLSTRKACCTDGSEPLGGGQSCDRESSGSVTTTQSTWDPSQNANPRRHSGIQQAGRPASMQYIPSSGSTTSSATLGHSSSHAIPQHQRLVPAQMGRKFSPASNASNQNHHMYDYDQQFSMSNQSYSSIQNNPPKHQYQNMQQSSSVYVPTASSPNVNNCNYAAEMITTMAGVSDSSAVRADLGCAPGMDCEVDNHLVFNVMDRYSGVGL